MHGYWGRTELTERRLREVPTAAGRRQLAYNTGDLVVPRTDGMLTYLGRRDHQIKTRGYRVELGEIEAVLCRHPDVSEAVLLAIPDDEVGHRLRAVVVSHTGQPLDEAELKRHCAATLPRYMVPEAIAFNATLPRTASDKIDRETLLRMTLASTIAA
jgi:acyl-coenzyme A synthetase/AMP-(fatty) acid ligase